MKTLLDIVELVTRLMQSEDIEKVSLGGEQVGLMNESWATIEIPDERNFYYEAGELDVAGQALYFIKPGGFTLHSNRHNAMIQGIICVTRGDSDKENNRR